MDGSDKKVLFKQEMSADHGEVQSEFIYLF